MGAGDLDLESVLEVVVEVEAAFAEAECWCAPRMFSFWLLMLFTSRSRELVRIEAILKSGCWDASQAAAREMLQQRCGEQKVIRERREQ